MQRIRSRKDIQRGVEELLRLDARLAPLLAQAGDVPLRLSTPDLAGLVSIIISQQVSRASAQAIHGRLLALIDPLETSALLAAKDEVFRQAGLSRPKQRTLLHIAEAIDTGRLDLEALCEMEAKQAIVSMTAIKGIGPWTAEIYLMFCAGHPDIFPAGDIALQEAAKVTFSLDDRPGENVLRSLATGWAPWRSVAARLLWSYYRVLKGDRDAMPL